MRPLKLHKQHFVCGVCGERALIPTTMGIESDNKFTSPIQLCQGCGPIELDLMQLCREATIACTDN